MTGSGDLEEPGHLRRRRGRPWTFEADRGGLSVAGTHDEPGRRTALLPCGPASLVRVDSDPIGMSEAYRAVDVLEIADGPPAGATKRRGIEPGGWRRGTMLPFRRERQHNSRLLH